MKKSHIILLLIIMVSVIVLITSLTDASSYETFAVADKNPDKSYHVVGKLVKAESMEYDPMIDPNRFTFFMEDNEGTIRKVQYPGPKPQDFERSEQIVLIGQSNKDLFYAEKILTKCPSKYNEETVQVKEAGI